MDNFTGDFFKLIGKPMTWNSPVYGNIAVHVTGISPNGRVAVLTIDGGEAATPAQRFPELSDGIGYAILGDLSKRTRVQNNIREVSGIGKVATVTTNPADRIKVVKENGKVVGLQGPRRTTAEKLPIAMLRKMTKPSLVQYANEHYSTITKLGTKAQILAAIEAQESKEITF